MEELQETERKIESGLNESGVTAQFGVIARVAIGRVIVLNIKNVGVQMHRLVDRYGRFTDSKSK